MSQLNIDNGSQGTSTMDGVIERLTYQHPTSGYTVLKLRTQRGVEVVAVGQMSGVNPGEHIQLEGVWMTHPQHGRQFRVSTFRTLLPATTEGIRKYLGSGLIKGVGPVTAKRIVEHFGPDALTIIDEEPDRLREVRGLGNKRAASITAAWVEQRAIKDVMICLQSLGVHTGHAVRIYKQYGDGAVDVVRTDPYRLARDIWGIGFKTADDIGAELGIPHDSPDRLAAGLRHALTSAADDNGHVYLPREVLFDTAVRLLDCTVDQLEAAMPRLIGDRDVFLEERDGEERIYLASLGGAEIAGARRLVRLIRSEVDRLSEFGDIDWEAALDWLINVRRIPALAERQIEAVRAALTNPVTVLTGGPGTGKSTTVRSIVTLARAKRARVLLVAPTGRAAKRLSELTGHPARTIHRLLKLQPGGSAAFDENNPLDADLLVVDESSMLDVYLFNTLVRALPSGCHLLLVGDADQLPSVGPGNVLHDLIASDVIPTVRLEAIFRQAEASAIVRNAHHINNGEMPQSGREIRDFAVVRVEEGADAAQEAAELVQDLVNRRLPRAYGIPSDQIQVLCPMNGGATGTRRLNETLQATLNPPVQGQPELRIAGRHYRAGDRLIALRNNYQLEVFNGDMAVIQSIDQVDQSMRLAFDDGRVLTVPFAQLDEFSHAFAISVHRAQGSEFRAVVIPLLTAHYVMLQRNLLYTAVTRARELVVLVAQPKAIAIAVRNDRISRRYTSLDLRLRELATD
ncbi:MAG: ATP-dependent RecD-like DNA helicase [Nitrolancea sp.]